MCVALGVVAGRAESFRVLHAFDHTSGAAVPYGSVIEQDGWLYGTTAYSQHASSAPGQESPLLPHGAMYKVRLDGSGFSIIKRFDAASGTHPFQGLMAHDGKVYGTTRNDGEFGGGTLYSVNVDGTDFRVLHAFQADTGYHPVAAPIIVGSKLYGMTSSGGSHGAAPEVPGSTAGVLYSYDMRTGAYRVEREFAFPGDADPSAIPGMNPYGSLVQVGEWLYGGTTDIRSRTSSGIIFRYRPSDRVFEVVHVFDGGRSGGSPYDSLAWDGNRYLYGTTLGFYPFHPLTDSEITALKDEGVIFRIDLTKSPSDHLHYLVIHDFALEAGDGAKPNSSMLVGPDGYLYGITHGSVGLGGKVNGTQYGTEFGTLYRLRPDGTEFTVLHTFDSLAAGLTPMRRLAWKDGTIYGTTAQGGDGPVGADPFLSPGNGTVWSYTVYQTPTSAGPLAGMPRRGLALAGLAIIGIVLVGIAMALRRRVN